MARKSTGIALFIIGLMILAFSAVMIFSPDNSAGYAVNRLVVAFGGAYLAAYGYGRLRGW